MLKLLTTECRETMIMSKIGFRAVFDQAPLHKFLVQIVSQDFLNDLGLNGCRVFVLHFRRDFKHGLC